MIVQKRDLSPESRQFLLDAIDSFCASLDDSPASRSLKNSVFKKLRPLKRSQDTYDCALSTFLQSEKDCLITNRRIRSMLSQDKSYADGGIIHTAARKIASILGPFSISEMLRLGRFGPGTTFQCRGSDTSRSRKFSLTDVSNEFAKTASALLAEYPLWCEVLTDYRNVCPVLTPVPGGRYSTVPKDTKTDRSIVVEPTINSWFQQGIGRSIRKRLLLAGVDLNDQTTNQRLARLGSISNDLATVDLSSASDLISTKLVEDLLPPDWFRWLNVTRSRRVLINGEWVELQKFSSMGNGFTFDLQSLIFYAISWAICVTEGGNPFWVSVFGDDIIVPTFCMTSLLQVFQDCGFSVNQKKSYWDGPFRESCGHDYFLGLNVRGVYIKDFVDDVDVMKVHNRLYEWAMRHAVNWSELRQLLLLYLDPFPRVPVRLGDVGVFSSFDEATPAIARDGWEGFRVRIMVPMLMRHERYDRFLLPDRLLGSEFQNNFVSGRFKPSSYRIREVVSLWDTECPSG